MTAVCCAVKMRMLRADEVVLTTKLGNVHAEDGASPRHQRRA
jgi:hypothetical protein